MCLILALTLTATSCGRIQVSNSTMSTEQQEELESNLSELDKALEEHAAFIHAKLAPPADSSQIQGLRDGLSGAQVLSLEIWYSWHNGCVDHLTDIHPLGRMLSIAESLQDRKMIQDVPFVDTKRKMAIKILDDGAGDGFFLDICGPHPRVFYHMLEDPFPQDYGLLQEFVDFLARVHSAGVSSEDPNGMVEFDLDKYQELEESYLKKLKEP